MAETPDDLLNPEKEVEAIRRLSQFYANGLSALKGIYFDIDPLKLDSEKVKRQVQEITDDLERGTSQWIEESFPEMYIAAAIVARKLINKELKFDKKGKLSLQFKPSKIETETIDTIGKSTFSFYQEALSGVRRKTSAMLDKIVEERIKQNLSEQTKNPITIDKLKSTVTDLIKENGVESLTDKSGKVWQLDTYAEMVARTQHTNIVNSATRNQALQEGYDLVRVTSHGATDSCAPFEGKIYSLTGATQGYPILDVASAGTHLFGPNCKHTYTPVSPRRAAELGGKYVGEDSPYLDLRKFANTKSLNVGQLVSQQRNLIRLFPTLSKSQQKEIISLARQSKSPALKALEDLYRL